MPPPPVLIQCPGEWDKPFSPEKRPGTKDDVDFMGTKREKILDFSPMRGKRAGGAYRQTSLPEMGRGSERAEELIGRAEITSLASLMGYCVPSPHCPAAPIGASADGEAPDGLGGTQRLLYLICRGGRRGDLSCLRRSSVNPSGSDNTDHPCLDLDCLSKQIRVRPRSDEAKFTAFDAVNQ
jgi:hypothetical protein